jgi:hypothetical protein
VSRCLLQRAVLPIDVDLDSTARAQSAHASGRPRTRQRRQEMDLTRVALQQHLGDPAVAPKLPSI